MNLKSRLPTLPLYPFLLAAWPILQLYVFNADKLLFSQVVVFLAAVLVVTLTLYLGLAWLFKDPVKAGVLVAFVALMFFLYGHIDAQLTKLLSRPVRSVLYPVWLAIFLLGVFVIAKIESLPNNLTLPLTGVGVVLVLFPLVGAARIGLKRAQAASEVTNPPLVDISRLDVDPDSLPDIYYIVLDEYGRADALAERYGYDNSGFTAALAERGFYVADAAHSNYALTFLSLASSLNMRYLDEVAEQSSSEAVYFSLVDQNEVAQVLKAAGYRYVHVNSGWGPTDRPQGADVVVPHRGVDEYNFAGVLYRTTMLNAFYPAVMSSQHRQVILEDFEQIGEVASMERPTFTLAHLLTPHPPYVFRADGSPVPASEVGRMMCCWWANAFNDAYVEQVQFTNTQVLALVDRILADSDQPPIIILQGDHGTKPQDVPDFEGVARERLSIFSAYYLPGEGEEALYPSITPVNTFRVIFDTYLGTELGLLEDHSYLSGYAQPGTFWEYVEQPD